MNFKFKRGHLITLLFSSIVIAVASLGMTYAWFFSNYQNTTNDISGSVLESYFDKAAGTVSGDPGTETNPFVITTPRHYENLVKLYTQKFYNPKTKQYEYFSDQDYYFEIGKKFDGTNYTVHEYDKYGADTGNYTTTLNLVGLSKVEPIGNDAHPFNSHIDGHDIKVSNFTVNSNANNLQWYNDVGIFGYVKTNAYVHNCYWDNFVIDATNANRGVTKGQTLVGHTDVEAAKHDENFRIGYLAGHIKTYESFENCYVNNCSIKSPDNTSPQQNDYGYFGMVEKDKAGSALPTGKNYSYTFDSSVWNQYFRNNLNTIGGQQLTLRNTIEGADYPNNEVDMENEYFESAVSKGDYLTSYWINGKTVDNGDTYAGRNFSLSTMGYVSGEKTSDPRKSRCYYYDTSSSSYKDPNALMKNTDLEMNENTTRGYYNHFDDYNSKWVYYYADNHYSNQATDGQMHVTFTFTSHNETAIGSSGSPTMKFKLTVDNTYVKTWNGTGKTGSGIVAWSCSPVTIDLPVGYHKFALTVHKHHEVGSLFKIKYDRTYIIYGNQSNNDVTQVDMNSDFTHAYSSSTKKSEYYVTNYTVDLQQYEVIRGTATWSDRTDEPNAVNTTAYTALADNTYVLGKNNAQYDLYYYTTSYIQLVNTSTDDYTGATFTFENSACYVNYVKIIIDPSTSTRHWVGDEEEVQTETNKYNHRCIDVVGGGIGFYYYNFSTSNQLKITRVQSEGKSASSTVVKEIASGDIGNRFYAPGTTNQSIVLYVKNVGSAIDEIDDKLGKMTFTYYQLNDSIFRALGNTVHPSYKKGASASEVNYVDFSTVYGDPKEDPDNPLRTFEDVEFTESLCKKCSYCCLDANGNILGAYDSDGNNRIGMTKDAEERIDTYVLVIGCFTNADFARWNLWVNTIKFEYKAAAGEGGTFGSVGYRSQGQSTITDTIINFNLTNIPASTQYMISVTYTGDTEKKYNIVIKSNKQITLIVYNYYPSVYTVYVNGTPMSGSSHTYTIPASTTSYPNFT